MLLIKRLKEKKKLMDYVEKSGKNGQKQVNNAEKHTRLASAQQAVHMSVGI